MHILGMDDDTFNKDSHETLFALCKYGRNTAKWRGAVVVVDLFMHFRKAKLRRDDAIKIL